MHGSMNVKFPILVGSESLEIISQVTYDRNIVINDAVLSNAINSSTLHPLHFLMSYECTCSR
jgi:hypothetical protein